MAQPHRLRRVPLSGAFLQRTHQSRSNFVLETSRQECRVSMRKPLEHYFVVSGFAVNRNARRCKPSISCINKLPKLIYYETRT